MSFFNKNFKNNFLLRLASLNSANVTVRFILGLITSKFLALFVGVEGIALLGNFRNFLYSMQSFSILGFTNGIVKYTSELKNDKHELRKMLSTIILSLLVVYAFVFLLSYLNLDKLNVYIFGATNDYSNVIIISLVLLPFIVANGLIMAVLNGFSKFKKFLRLNIINQLVLVIISLVLIWKYGLEGALLGLVIGQAAVFLTTFLFLLKNKLILSYFSIKYFEFNYIKKLTPYSLMILFSAILVPLVTIEIRNFIIQEVSPQGAGYWETMQRISRYYLMFATTLISLYLLPKFSSIKNSKEFRQEVFSFYKTLLPIFLLVLSLIFLFRKLLLKVVFTEEFLPTQDLFVWQLLGDFFKITALVLSYQFLAKRMTVFYLLTEAISLLMLYFFSICFVTKYGVVGANIAHLISYCLYLLIILMIFYKHLFSKKIITYN